MVSRAPQVIQALPKMDAERRIEYEHNTCAVQLEFIAVRHRATSSRREQVAGEGLGFLAGSLTCFVLCLDRVGRCWIWNLTRGANGQPESWRREMDGHQKAERSPRLAPILSRDHACANHLLGARSGRG
jgi:hypothetical protein